MLLDSWPSVSVITWGCLRVSWWPRLLPVFALLTPEECNWFCARNWAPGNRRSVKRGISVHMSHSNTYTHTHTHTHICTCTIHTSSYWQLSLYWFVNHNSSTQRKKKEKNLAWLLLSHFKEDCMKQYRLWSRYSQPRFEMVRLNRQMQMRCNQTCELWTVPTRLRLGELPIFFCATLE